MNALNTRCWKTLQIMAGLLAVSVGASGQSYTAIDYPGAANTYANGINNSGDIVGYYGLAGVQHGYLVSGGKFTAIDYPGAKSTQANGINSKGDIVGAYAGTDGHTHGYLLSNGTFTALDFPGGGDTTPEGINSAGDVVGMLQLAGKPMQGFQLKGGVWTAIDTFLDRPSTTMNCYLGVNDAGAIVGHLGTRAGGSHGVLYNKGLTTQLDYGAGGNLWAYGINLAGDVVGYYYDAGVTPHGFLRKGGRYTPIDFPGSPHTMAYGLNDSGQVVGHFQDSKGVFHGFVAQVAPPAAPPAMLTVDDDGADCPGALSTIQDAVARAAMGTTILVCPGTYRGTVTISGAEKTGIKLIAAGRTDEVVLQGDYTERDGFHLQDVTNVLIRGFTVRDFGNLPTSASQWGDGNQIYLEAADYNTIEGNRLVNGDMVGIKLVDSGNNLIRNNVAWVDKAALANCGIHMQGAKSANNLILQNFIYGNNMSAIMLSGAGTGNRVMNNVALSNGRWGITNTGTDGTWIEGNRVSYNAGPWGTTPFPASAKGAGVGINIATSTGVTVFDNRGRNNTSADISWDGTGQVKFDANACDVSTPAESCASATAASGTIAQPAMSLWMPGPGR